MVYVEEKAVTLISGAKCEMTSNITVPCQPHSGSSADDISPPKQMKKKKRGEAPGNSKGECGVRHYSSSVAPTKDLSPPWSCPPCRGKNCSRSSNMRSGYRAMRLRHQLRRGEKMNKTWRTRTFTMDGGIGP